MLQIAWLFGAAVTVLCIGLDMRRLRVNRVGLPMVGWLGISACVGPLAGAAYLIKRRSTRRTLIDAALALAGSADQPIHLRRTRLLALAHSGLLGRPILKACLAALELDSSDSPRPAMKDVSPSL